MPCRLLSLPALLLLILAPGAVTGEGSVVTGAAYTAPVVALINGLPFSAGEFCAEMLKQLPNVTALGDTLFPAESVFAGIRDDFTGSFLVRLRWIHPVVAVAVSGLLLYLVGLLDPGEGHGRRAADLLRALVLVQVGAGALNVILLAPLWMQVVHLLLADTVWIAFVVFAVEARAEAAVRLPGAAAG